MKSARLFEASVLGVAAIVGVMIYIAGVLILPAITDANKTWNAEREKLIEKNEEYIREHGGWSNKTHEVVPPAVKLAGY
jgi:hypothetical protein